METFYFEPGGVSIIKDRFAAFTFAKLIIFSELCIRGYEIFDIRH
jgi:hypothetical protein